MSQAFEEEEYIYLQKKLQSLYEKNIHNYNQTIKWNYTQIYTEKKDQIKPIRKPIIFVIKPQLMLTKHKQLCAIVVKPCYHQSFLL